ncbi:hypothetical protein [Prosthecobacter fusiformis]|uniref:hypothetical protein n=1 Tax=Prosthecobacter fusiformis TaxID=48464 RepID=UPI0014151B0F|nr:hypothetical protein [Prosthecobacter fusiformis]
MKNKVKTALLCVARMAEKGFRPIVSRIYGRRSPSGIEEWKHVAFSWGQFGEDLIAWGILKN